MPSLVQLKDSDVFGFERPALPCPTSTLKAYVKQVNPAELSASERGFLDASFGGFLTGVSTPGAVSAMLAARYPHHYTGHENRLPRRYDGDVTLPHGRYYTVCENAEGGDSGTLGYELKFYKRARTAEGHVEVLDPGVTSEREMIGLLGFTTSAYERIIVRFTPFAQRSDVTTPDSINLSIPIKIEKLQVDNVLDLRRPTALNWVFETVPNLHVLGQKGDKFPCFPFRKKLTAFGEILPSFVDQSRGGGNFDKLVGMYLRQIGVSGLVFPSARNDAYTYVVDGEPQEFHGWSFVDYREAPQPKLRAFLELRPEWPRTLTLEGGDDHEPRPAAFADEFQIHMTENFASTGGTLFFRGLAQRTEAYQIVDSMEAAARFRLPDLRDEDVTELVTFAVSLGSRQAFNFASMVLYSLLGLEKARIDLQNVVKDQLRDHPIAKLLTRCVAAPPTDEHLLGRSNAFLALFRSS